MMKMTNRTSTLTGRTHRVTAMMLATALIAAILTWNGGNRAQAASAASLPFVQDFSAEAKVAQQKRVPILVLFTAPGCAYCERVRQEFLIPMARNPEYADKVIVRQVEVGGDDKLRDFTGQTTTHGEFARLHKAALTPTVKFFDAQGNELPGTLVGLTTVDFYNAYLDRGIDEGLKRIRGGVKSASR